MKKTSEIGVICAIFGCFCVIGCQSTSSTAVSKTAAPAINTPEGMTEYLRSRNIPALKSIEPWQSQFGAGIKLTTPHYEIYTTLLEPLMLSQMPGFVESAYRGYQAQLPEPIETPTHFTVYLFASRQQWEIFTMDFTGPQAPLYLQLKRGAYYLNGACVAYNIGLEDTFSGLGHEGWHQFNSRYFKYRLPSWLDEGIAMLFEESVYDKGFYVFQPDRNLNRLGSLKLTFIKRNIIPLRELVATNPGEVVEDANNTIAFYCQAYALVRFLREDNYGKRLLKYQKLLLDGLNGQWPLPDEDRRIAADRNIPITVGWNKMVGTMLFRHYIGDNFDNIEKEYLAFCRKIVYPVQVK
jgi:hypothetical protein